MPIIGRHVEAITRSNVYRAHMSLFEKWPLFVIRINKLNWRVVFRYSVITGVDVGSLLGSNYCEIFVAFKHAHHVLHGVGMWFR